jgi:hypothetical protein
MNTSLIPELAVYERCPASNDMPKKLSISLAETTACGVMFSENVLTSFETHQEILLVGYLIAGSV